MGEIFFYPYRHYRSKTPELSKKIDILEVGHTETWSLIIFSVMIPVVIAIAFVQPVFLVMTVIITPYLLYQFYKERKTLAKLERERWIEEQYLEVQKYLKFDDFLPQPKSEEPMNKDRPIPPEIYDVLKNDERVRPIRGFPDYFITSDGRILSNKGRKPKNLATYHVTTADTDYEVIDLYKNESQHRRSVDRLYDDHFGVAIQSNTAKMVEEYRNDGYYGSEEIKTWVENVLAKEINSRD